MPDFDIDFCMVVVKKVIQYVQRKYGREQSKGRSSPLVRLLSKAGGARHRAGVADALMGKVEARSCPR